MTCPKCGGPMPKCEAVTYHDKCENCAVGNTPPLNLPTFYLQVNTREIYCRTDRHRKGTGVDKT